MKKKINKSFGIICLYEDKKYIMIKRLNSIEYFNIITGKYKNYKELESYFNNITKAEWETFKNEENFKKLWDILWCNANVMYTPLQKYKFDRLRTILNIDNIDKCVHINSTELSFPKGKKLSNLETDIECAKREFVEETGISLDNIEITDKTFTHEYIGSDLNNYCIKYFFAKINKKIDLSKLNFDYKEVKNVLIIDPISALEKTLNRNTRDLLYKLSLLSY